MDLIMLLVISAGLTMSFFYFFIQEHFLAHAVPHHPVLLLLDGCSTYSDLSLQESKLPPRTTHECQPLDYSF